MYINSLAIYLENFDAVFYEFLQYLILDLFVHGSLLLVNKYV